MSTEIDLSDADVTLLLDEYGNWRLFIDSEMLTYEENRGKLRLTHGDRHVNAASFDEIERMARNWLTEDDGET